MLEYDKMVKKTRDFYGKLQIDIPDEYIRRAVQSLTMPQYAKVFNDNRFHKKIGDHGVLATVGDAVCGAFLMLNRYSTKTTKHKKHKI